MSERRPKTAVILDLGNVVLDYDVDRIVASLALDAESGKLLRDELFFLEHALAPAGPRAAGIRFTSVTPDRVDAGLLQAAQVVFLANVRTLGEEALDRLRSMIGFSGQWADLLTFLPQGWESDPKRRRSATASTFAATLELVKEGKLQLRQTETFAPIELRSRDGT